MLRGHTFNLFDENMSCTDSECLSMPELESQSDGSAVTVSTVQNVFDWFTNAFLNYKFKFLNVLGSVLFLWTAWMKQNLMTRGCLGWPIQVRRTCMSDNSSLGDGDSSDWVIESVDTGLIINGPSISPPPRFPLFNFIFSGTPQRVAGAKMIGLGFTIKMSTYFMLISAPLVTENPIEFQKL